MVFKKSFPVFYLCKKYILILLEKYSGELKIKTVDGKRYIWDFIRKKWLVLQPEEFVRQIFILYLLDQNYPKGKIAVEKKTGQAKYSRYDLLIYDENMQPFLLAECKTFDKPMMEDIDIQLGSYNLYIKAPFICVTNGKITIFSKLNKETGSYEPIENLHLYPHNSKN